MGFISKIKEIVISKYAGSTIRHLVGLSGGVLLGFGLDPELVGNFIPVASEVAVGVGLVVIAQVWSWFEKKKK